VPSGDGALKRYVVVGGEAELALLLHIFPEGVEELDGAFAVYAEEPPLGFDVVEADDVPEGWEDRWRAFHHGATVGRFWVGPPWEEPPDETEAIVIDPGRAFGTGAHPTTRLCLEALLELERGSLLDVGCGSGVLSIAAALLGFAPVTGVDTDRAAVEATAANAAANGVAVETRVGDATTARLPDVDVTVANISLDAVNMLRPTSPVLVTSGYLVADRPSPVGYAHVRRFESDGWAADVHAREVQ